MVENGGARQDEWRKASEIAREQRRARFLEQARCAVATLDMAAADPVARGALGEAVQELGEDLPEWATTAQDRYLAPRPPELPIRTERLVMREPRMDDLDALFGAYCREDVSRYLLTPPATREAMIEMLLGRTGRGDDGSHRDRLSLVVEWESRVVGDLVLLLKGPSRSQGEIGWTLHPDYAGRGFATEAARVLLDLAFGHYRMHRVYADLDVRNERSKALCERLGMRQETHALKDYWSKGEWTDSYRYALLAEEYAATL